MALRVLVPLILTKVMRRNKKKRRVDNTQNEEPHPDNRTDTKAN
jgi:hypothetical protein